MTAAVTGRRFFSIPAYALMVPLLPPLMLYSNNITRLSLAHALGTAAAFLAGFLALMLLLRLLIRRPDVTDLPLVIAFAAVFLPVNFIGPDQSHLPWVTAWGAVAALAILWRESRRFLPAIASIGALVFLAPLIVQIYYSPTWKMRAEIRNQTAHAFDDLPAPAAAVRDRRDIYYIIFDRYARGDILRRVFGYDNSEFIGALRQRGFFIAEDAYSNYQRTAHSVVSSLNLDYLDRLDSPAMKGKSDWLPLYELLDNFRIGRFLKAQGYEIHFSGAWWEPTRRIAIADVFHNFYEMPELARAVYERSLIVKAARMAGFKQADPLWWQCQRSRLTFEALADLAGQTSRPKFVFAHLLIPHPPFVTHQTGRCMDIKEAQSRSRNENYIGQIEYTNQQIIAMVDRMLAAPGLKPIIILQADEGPVPAKFAGNEVTVMGRDLKPVDWQRMTPDELREKMAILSAMYLPGIDVTQISKSTSPVNTFRRILNSYFHVPIAGLADRHMIFQSNTDIYRFREVTGELLLREVSDLD